MVFGNAMYTVLLLCNPNPEPLVGPLRAEHADNQSPLTESESSSDPAPPEPPERTWDDGSMYLSLGLAPMSTLHVEGFHPGLRYDVETGLAWERGRARIWVGPDFHILHYYGRKKPGFGVDAMATLSFEHVYARAGAGTAMGIPARAGIDDTRPMMGGLVGGGFVGRLDHVEGRIGVDYDVRIDTTGRVAQTVLVALRLSFGP
jgi:hypothetical protein